MKLKFNIFLSLLLLFLSGSLFSQEVSVADKNEALFSRYVQHIAPYSNASLEIVLEQSARFFMGTPYVAHTLDQSDEEHLVVNLFELDCVTFVENVLALSLTARSNELSFENFKKNLQSIRFRNGELSDYSSRLHYTSDWIYDNENCGLLENISQQLSGVKETKQINFMSSHRSAYKQLANDDAMWSKIVALENSINNRGGFYYLPKGLIAEKAADIPQMAVIGFATSIDGLDTTHLGFAFHNKDGKLTFIHASSAKMEVVIDTQTLSNYCLSQKNCEGIIVGRVVGGK